MDKLLNKAKTTVKKNKKTISFLLTIFIVGIIAGSIFICCLSKTDQSIVKSYIETFIANIKNNNLDYLNCLKNNLISNLFFISLIWILGISIIGVPINIICYFLKSFILGFSLSAFVLTFLFK